MIFGIALLIAIWILYKLLVQGFLWKIILGICGALMIHVLLWNNFPGTHSIGFVGLPWSAVIGIAVLLLAMMHTKSE
jgi:uncharacterized membrane protein YeaQ/YmgE (transglycosylase-associated protein family)